MFLRKPYGGKELQNWATEQLVAAFQRSGEQQYFNELFTRHLHLVYYTCRKFLNDKEAVRDATMQVFAKAYVQLSKRDVRSFSNWLYTLAKHECIDLLREQDKQISQQELLIEEKLEPYEYLQVENEANFDVDNTGEQSPEAIVRRALLQLNEQQRKSLELFYFEEKSYREIAGIMNLPEGQVKSLLQNGKRRLRQILEPIFLGKDNKWP